MDVGTGSFGTVLTHPLSFPTPSGLPASFLTPEMTPVLHPMAPHHLLGVPAPYSFLYPLQTQIALDIAMATKQDEDGDT